MKKCMSLFLAVVMCLGLAANTQAAEAGSEAEASGNVISTPYGDLPADGEKITLNLGHAATENSLQHKSILYLADKINENSNGLINVVVFPNGQLGSDSEMLTSTVNGDLDMFFSSGPIASTLISEANLFSIPFLTEGYSEETIVNVLKDSEFRTEYDKIYENVGLKLLATPLGMADVVASKEKLEKPEDYVGLNIRTPQAEVYMIIWKALNANPTPLAYSELYTALQQGVVDAFFNNYDNIISGSFYELLPYVSALNTQRGNYVILMNDKKFKSLPAEYQAFIENISDDAGVYIQGAYQDAVGEGRAKLTDLGVTISDVDDATMAEFKTKCENAITEMEALVKNDDLIALLRSCLDQN